jgi:F0F1-type ATP synthase assembly protein I
MTEVFGASESDLDMAPDGAVRTAHRGVTSAVADSWVAGGSFFGSIMAGTLLGWLADRWLSTEPWLLIVGIALGSANGFYRMWELVRKPTGKQAVRVR